MAVLSASSPALTDVFNNWSFHFLSIHSSWKLGTERQISLGESDTKMTSLFSYKTASPSSLSAPWCAPALPVPASTPLYHLKLPTSHQNTGKGP